MSEPLPTLLFLTDLANGAQEEDLLISDFLRRDFKVIVGHPKDCESLEDKADAIIIRNTWNRHTHGQPEPWYRRWRGKKLPFHDDLYVREGAYKDYLLALFKAGYPVIPTIDTVEDLPLLPISKAYFIKPKDGMDAIGAKKVTPEELLSLKLEHYLIQPFINFAHEASFYYLDKRLQYALYAPDKAKRWSLVEFAPSAADLAFAQKFIDQNPQKYGIERIDACRLPTGELLLMEVTDQGGAYLSIPLLPEPTRKKFLGNLSASIKKNCLRA